MVPMFNSQHEREFYAWAQSFTNPDAPAGRSRRLPGECLICGGGGYVQTRRKVLTVCPRWNKEFKECQR